MLLAQGDRASEIGFFKLLIVAMIFGSVAWCVSLLRRGGVIVHPLARLLFAAALLRVEFFLAPNDFGQREHLFVILLLPYLLAVTSGAVHELSLAERCALGITAGLAIWFKPQETVVVVVLELFLALRARSVRRLLAPDFLALVLSSGLILALVRFTTPLYFTSTMPLLFNTYWALGTDSAFTLALGMRRFFVIAAALLLACLVLRHHLRQPATVAVLVLCSSAAAGAYAIQHTRWSYHIYPYQALLLVAVAYFVVDLLQPAMGRLAAHRTFTKNATVALSIVMLLLVVGIALHPAEAFPRSSPPSNQPLDILFAQYPPSTAVYVFSTDVAPMGIAYNHGLRWGGRFAHLWMLPPIVQNELGPVGGGAPFKRLTPQTLTQLSALQREQSAEDLNYWKPSLVLIQRCTVETPCQAMGDKDFDMLAWFLQSPDFAAAWSHYRKQATAGNFDVYAVVS